MIRQDDEVLNKLSDLPFKDYGCALFDLTYYGVMYGSYVFERGVFLTDCKEWEGSTYITSSTSIASWNGMCSAVNLPYRIVIENGTHKLPADRQCRDDELQLLYLYNPDTGLNHFVCADRDDNITYDSLGDSLTGKAYKDGVGYIESKRVLRHV